MSSCSSEVDVVKTRITTCDDDNDILYAYQSKAGYANQGVQSNTSYEEQQKTIVDILNRCKIIQDAIQNLDKKFKTIHGKVSKIYRFRTKLIWQNRKPLGYAYKHYTYLLSRKVKLQKKKKDVTPPASFPYAESYSPTTPVKRPRNDSQSNMVGTYYPSQDSMIHDNEDQEMRLSQSPTFPPYTQEDSEHYISDERMERPPYIAALDNQGHSSTCVFSAAQASTSVPAAVLEQGNSSVAYNSEMMAYPTLLEKNSLGRYFSSSCIAHTTNHRYASSLILIMIPLVMINSSMICPFLPIESAPYVLKQDFPDDPATWKVEEVILFLQHIDPESFTPIADTFRQHDIDGIALLLLQSEVMIKYMGIKLGTALKLCHYIEKLKTEKGIKV